MFRFFLLITIICALLFNPACKDTVLPEVCAITDIVVEPYCNDDGEILIDFEFNYSGTHTAFEVAGNGYQFGPFTYGELFYNVGPFPNVNDMMCELVIQFDDCSEDTFGWCDTFEGCETPNTCAITDIIVEPYCNNDGEILLDFEFDYSGNHSVFEVVGSGYQFGPFTFGELFYTVGPFPSVNDMMCELVIQFDDCSEDTFGWCDTFEGCETPPSTCTIYNIVVEPYCNNEGELLLDFEFDYTGNHSVFEVAGSGYQFGPFTYGDLFYTVGPFPNLNDMMCELVIQFDDCAEDTFGWCDTFEGCL